MLRKLILPVAVLAVLVLNPLLAMAGTYSGADPASDGCYIYGPNSISEGDTFVATVKCNNVGSQVYGFEFGTTFSAPDVTVDGNTAKLASQQGAVYTRGDFDTTEPLEGMNALATLYAVSHTGDETSTGTFSLGSFAADVPFGIVADGTVTVDLRDFKLSDRLGQPVSVTIPDSQLMVNVTNLDIALRHAGTLDVQSDGAMANLVGVSVDLEEASPDSQPTVAGSSAHFTISAHQYATDNMVAAMTVQMRSHLSCTKDVALADGKNEASVFGETITLKAGNAVEDNEINIVDATLVGSYFGLDETGTSDINVDGHVDIYDLVHIGRNYGISAGDCF